MAYARRSEPCLKASGLTDWLNGKIIATKTLSMTLKKIKKTRYLDEAGG